jgi:hypothetical protein
MKSTYVLAVIALAMITLTATRGQTGGSAAPARQAPISLQVALSVGGASYAFTGAGECTHVPAGSIYNASAAIWNARQQNNDRNVNFTLFRLKSGGDMFALLIGMGGKVHQVKTVKVGQKGDLRGSGKVTFLPSGSGGSFTLDATADTGAKIVGKITCSAFGEGEGNG